jgi:HTH-type transcriptional regulator, sugar sensing transcriptional regulator
MAKIDLLKEFGFKEKEAAVYLGLLELGEAKVHDIARKAKISRPTTYEILEKLAEEGMVVSFEKNKIKHFIANDPEIFKRDLEAKQHAFGLILPELKSVYNRLKSKPKITFHDGIDGIKAVFEDTLTAQNKTLRGILSMEDLFRVPGKEFMDDYVKRRVEKGYSLNVIRSKPKDVAPEWPGSPAEKRDLRYPPENMVFDMTTYTYDNKVGLISTEKENFGLIIESEEFSKTMRHLFEALWQISAPA